MTSHPWLFRPLRTTDGSNIGCLPKLNWEHKQCCWKEFCVLYWSTGLLGALGATDGAINTAINWLIGFSDITVCDWWLDKDWWESLQGAQIKDNPFLNLSGLEPRFIRGTCDNCRRSWWEIISLSPDYRVLILYSWRFLFCFVLFFATMSIMRVWVRQVKLLLFSPKIIILHYLMNFSRTLLNLITSVIILHERLFFAADLPQFSDCWMFFLLGIH